MNGTQLAAVYYGGTVIAWSYPSGKILFQMNTEHWLNEIKWNPFRQDVFASCYRVRIAVDSLFQCRLAIRAWTRAGVAKTTAGVFFLPGLSRVKRANPPKKVALIPSRHCINFFSFSLPSPPLSHLKFSFWMYLFLFFWGGERFIQFFNFSFFSFFLDFSFFR